MKYFAVNNIETIEYNKDYKSDDEYLNEIINLTLA